MTSRRFVMHRRARLSECDDRGRARLDAVACWLQDAAADDVRDAGMTDEDGLWVVRRTCVVVETWPQLGEDLEVATWASGARGSAAERRTMVKGRHGGVSSTALWVALDPVSRRPMRLTERFFDTYGPFDPALRPSIALTHPEPPEGATTRPFPLRVADYDRAGHVNNAVYFEAVEEITAPHPPTYVDVEYRGGLAVSSRVDLVVESTRIWFVSDGAVAASAQLGANPLSSG